MKPTGIKNDQDKPEVGLQYNEGKLRWRNFPLFLIKPLIQVATAGEAKYSTFNFLKGHWVLDHMDSLIRHYESFENPHESDNDPESGASHMAHVAWRALMICFVLTFRPDLDNRYKIQIKKEEETK